MNTKDLFLNSEKPLIDRPLIAYAFLAQTTRNSGDLLSGLAPIFKPIAKERVGQCFNSVEFAEEVQKLYGIVVHPWAVDDLASRLEAAGLLFRNKPSPTSEEYVYAEIDEDFDEVKESEIRVVIQEFIEFAKPVLTRNKLEIKEKALEEAFLNQLVSMDFHSILLKPDRAREDLKKATTLSVPKKPEELQIEQEISAQSKIELLCASFIVDIYDRNKRLYDLVARIASGALIAEVVLNIQSPGTSITLSSLKVVLDAPFVMSLLDLTSEESTVYARSLFDMLRTNGAKIFIFRHSVDEIISNLKGVIRNVTQGVGYGATARRLRSNTFEVYLRSIMQDVETALSRYDIKILESPNTQTSYQYFSEGDERLFYQSLDFQNPIAQQRDAASLAGIVRLRGGKTARMSHFHLAQYVFITANSWMAQRAARFAVTHQIQSEKDLPPIVTDRYFAGLLWVVFGGKVDEITKYRLLANCTAALEPRNDVIAKMHRFLSQLDENKASHFRALMTDHRSGQHLMQLTLGDSVLISSTSDAEQVLEKIETTFAQKHRKEYDEKVNELTLNHEKQISQLETQTEALAEAAYLKDAQVIAVTGQLEDLKKKSEELDQALMEEKRLRMERNRQLIERSVLHAIGMSLRRQKSISAAGGFLLFCLTAIAAGLLWDHDVVLFVATIGSGALGYLGFWKNPDLVFGTHLTDVREEAFQSKVEELGLIEEIEGFEIDWKSGKVITKASQTVY